jgi:hypothetical protein
MARPKKRSTIPRELDLVLVEWVDSEKEDEWTDYPPAVGILPTMRTVGFYYKNVHGAVVLSQTIDKKVFHGGDGMVEGTFSIPNKVVQSIIIIRRHPKSK